MEPQFPTREHYVLHVRRVPLSHCVIKPASSYDGETNIAEDAPPASGGLAAPMAGNEGERFPHVFSDVGQAVLAGDADLAVAAGGGRPMRSMPWSVTVVSIACLTAAR